MQTGAHNDNIQTTVRATVPVDSQSQAPGRTPARAARLTGLKSLIRSLEGWDRGAGVADPATGEPPEGLLADGGWMQEAWADSPDAYTAALQFLLSGLRMDGKPVLWVIAPGLTREHGLPYGPGLKALGLDPARVILVRARTEADALWALDEGLRSGALSAVVGETGGIPLSASRRLALTAKERGLRCLLLVRSATPAASAAYSRWRVRAAPSAPVPYDVRLPGAARVNAALVKHRGGRRPQTHELEWHDATHHFHMAPALADGAVATPASRVAG